MGITIRTMTTVMGRSGKPERPSFFPIRAHLLTTALRAAVVSLPLVGPCALPEASAGCFSRGGRQCRSFSNCRHCLCGWQRAAAPFAALQQTLVPFRDKLPPACENLPLAALSQLWTMPPAPSIFFCMRQKKQNRPLRGQKGNE